MSWVPLRGQSYSANPYDLRSTRRKKLRPVSLPVRYRMHTRPMRPRPAPRSIPPSGSAMDLPGNPRPDPPHLRRGGRRDRETDRQTHTHTHTQRERERERERCTPSPIFISHLHLPSPPPSPSPSPPPPFPSPLFRSLLHLVPFKKVISYVCASTHAMFGFLPLPGISDPCPPPSSTLVGHVPGVKSRTTRDFSDRYLYLSSWVLHPPIPHK